MISLYGLGKLDGLLNVVAFNITYTYSVPLSKTSGRSAEVLRSMPAKPKMALSYEKVPLSERTQKKFFLQFIYLKF